MEGKVLARIAAIVFVAVAITATVIEMTREDVSTAPAWAASAVRGVHAPGVPINVPADRPRRSP